MVLGAYAQALLSFGDMGFLLSIAGGVAIGLSLQMESFKSKLLPLIIGILVFIMAALDLIKSTAAGDGKEVVFSQGVAVDTGGMQGRGRRIGDHLLDI